MDVFVGDVLELHASILTADEVRDLRKVVTHGGYIRWLHTVVTGQVGSGGVRWVWLHGRAVA